MTYYSWNDINDAEENIIRLFGTLAVFFVFVTFISVLFIPLLALFSLITFIIFLLLVISTENINDFNFEHILEPYQARRAKKREAIDKIDGRSWKQIMEEED